MVTQRAVLNISRNFCKNNYTNQTSDQSTALETAHDLKSELRKVYWRLKMRTTSLSILTVVAFVYEFYPISVVSTLLTLQSWSGSKTHPLHSDLVLSLKVSEKDASLVEITTFKKKKLTAKIDTILPATELLPAYRALQSRLKKPTTDQDSGPNSSSTDKQTPVGFESDESPTLLTKLFSNSDVSRLKLQQTFVANIRDDINGCYADIAEGQTLKFIDHADRFFFYFRVGERPHLLAFPYADERLQVDLELLFRILNGNRPLKLRKDIDLSALVSAEEEEFFLLGGKKKQTEEIGGNGAAQAIADDSKKG